MVLRYCKATGKKGLPEIWLGKDDELVLVTGEVQIPTTGPLELFGFNTGTFVAVDSDKLDGTLASCQ